MNNSNVWLVRCGEGGSAIDPCIFNDLIAIRFPSIADITNLTLKEVLAEVSQHYRRNDHTRLANELFAFANEMQIGDIVLTPDASPNRRRYFAGTITSDYFWDKENLIHEMRHVRSVDWLSYLEWDAIPVEFKSIKYYQRAVLKIDDQTVRSACDAALQEPKTKADLLAGPPQKTPTTPRARKPVTPRAPKASAAPRDRVCTQCHLRKPFSQFAGSSTVCGDCG